MQLDENHVPFLIEVTLEYDDGKKPPSSEAFLYFNDIELSQADINALFVKTRQIEPFSAIEYGLPQLAPINFIEQSTGDNHPYSEVTSMVGLDKMKDDIHHINSEADLLYIGSIHEALATQAPTENYRSLRKAFLKELADELLSQVEMIELELNIETPLSPSLLAKINNI